MADFRREYGIPAAAIPALTEREFVWLIRGLSDQSVWKNTVINEPVTLTGDAAREFLDNI